MRPGEAGSGGSVGDHPEGQLMFGLIGMTGAEIYRNFHDGPGPDGLIDGAVVVNEISGTYGERAQQIRALVARMESAWQGDAAGAAQRGAGPLAVEHDMSSMALGTAQDLTSRQAGSFSEAKGRVVPVPPKPELLNPAVVFTSPAMVIDHERRLDEHSAAAQNNVDVMNGYSGASEYNTENLPTSYGKLSDDQSGIDVGTNEVGGVGGAVINTPGSADSGDDTTRSTAAGRDSSEPVGGSRTPGGSSGGGPGVGGGASGGGSSGSGPGSSPGVTTPETFVPDPSPSPVGSSDVGTGRVPGTSVGPLSPGVGAVVAGRGGFGGGAGPFGGGGAGPRGGVPAGPGAGVGADPRGVAARPGSVTGPLAAGGRGGPGAGGFPVSTPGRGRDDEDIEHQRPEWLEGGDPDELFGTDVVTAPPTIGADD
jgi:hypothetical protein